MPKASLKILVPFFLIFFVASSCHSTGGSSGIKLNQLHLPDDFHINIYARNLPDARSMALSSGGVLFVGTRKAGKVFAVLDRNQDGIGDETIVFAAGLNMPNGVAVQNGSLYVAEINRILRYDQVERRLHEKPDAVVVNDSFPRDRHHGWKYIMFGPDGILYVPIGAPCNVCEESDPRYASIMRMHPDGNGLEIYAHGIRNTVGFDWHPETRELWFTNNGRRLGSRQVCIELRRIKMSAAFRR